MCVSLCPSVLIPILVCRAFHKITITVPSSPSSSASPPPPPPPSLTTKSYVRILAKSKFTTLDSGADGLEIAVPACNLRVTHDPPWAMPRHSPPGEDRPTLNRECALVNLFLRVLQISEPLEPLSPRRDDSEDNDQAVK